MDVDKMAEILRKEYVINTMEDLNKAISKLPKIDISPFCKTIKGDGGKDD